jgi:subfamily B ATP-binding cassette protein MsbA
MKRFSRILFYLRSQKGNIVLYVLFNVLSILFSLVSLAMLGPFLYLLFGKEQLTQVRPEWHFSAAGILDYFKYVLSQLILNYGAASALGRSAGSLSFPSFSRTCSPISLTGYWHRCAIT